MTTAATLLLAGPDQRGLVARTTQLLYELGANVISADHRPRPPRPALLSAHPLRARRCQRRPTTFEARVAELCQTLDMAWRLVYAEQVKRTAILLSKQDHCL